MSSGSTYPTTINGALRYIDKAAIQRAFAAVKEFDRHCLGVDIVDGQGPVAPMRAFPQHFMKRDGGDYITGAKTEKGGFGFCDDAIMLYTHGTTHIDALCHVFADGMMFGDIPATEVTSSGANHLGAETIPPILTRALVVDAVPADREWLKPGEAIPAAQIDAYLATAGLTPEPGDALLVRTASYKAFKNGEIHELSSPGLAADFVDWAKKHRISVLGADNIAVEVLPSHVPGVATPLHTELLRGEGVMFVELLNLEIAAGRGAFEAMLTINPLRIVGGTGSPVAPMLIL